MLNAIAQFRENVKRIRELGALAGAVETLTTAAIDVSDILRSQLVLVVSALDHVIHEIVRVGMIEAAKGQRPKTDAYYRFHLPVTAIETALSGADHETWIGESVRKKLSWKSFQDADAIAEACRLICGVNIWEAVGTELGARPQDLKVQLRLIVERRNKIAHEADMDPTSPGFRWPISASLVDGAIEFVQKIVEAIFRVVK